MENAQRGLSLEDFVSEQLVTLTAAQPSKGLTVLPMDYPSYT